MKETELSGPGGLKAELKTDRQTELQLLYMFKYQPGVFLFLISKSHVQTQTINMSVCLLILSDFLSVALSSHWCPLKTK